MGGNDTVERVCVHPRQPASQNGICRLDGQLRSTHVGTLTSHSKV